MPPQYVYRVLEIIDVHDGDSYKLRLDLGFHLSIQIWVRLHRWNCPEIATSQGQMAQHMANQFLRDAKSIVVQSFKDEQSFSRWVCDVWVDDRLLGEILEKEGLATVMPKFKL